MVVALFPGHLGTRLGVVVVHVPDLLTSDLSVTFVTYVV